MEFEPQSKIKKTAVGRPVAFEADVGLMEMQHGFIIQEENNKRWLKDRPREPAESWTPHHFDFYKYGNIYKKGLAK